MMAKPQKILLAFDFDHTILDGNSDVQVQKLHNGPLPDAVTKLYSGRDWNHYMAAVFDLLHRQNISAEDIRQNILSLSLVSGMKELFDHLRQDIFEVIIISDANYQFIDWHLRENQFDEFIAQIYSNPAKFDENGKLNLEFYHRQTGATYAPRTYVKAAFWRNMSPRENLWGYYILEYSTLVMATMTTVPASDWLKRIVCFLG
ncbi:hypothetical protein EB796_018311 [Bugula neritina]|uniref:Uncharacterized protein n=1 Tax=Bugula neritina TaxID=10212 RepID=A0A7J7JCK8_BUGNE|nr:hypothetical protein EB796_018311 [Bugula neritina]